MVEKGVRGVSPIRSPWERESSGEELVRAVLAVFP